MTQREKRRSQERAIMVRLLRKHGGCYTAVAAAWPRHISRQGIGQKVKALGLEAEAEEERQRGRVPDDDAEALMLSAIAETRNLDEAASRLGLGRRTICRRVGELGVSSRTLRRKDGGK